VPAGRYRALLAPFSTGPVFHAASASQFSPIDFLVGEIPGGSDNLSIKGCEGQGAIGGSHSTVQPIGVSRLKEFEPSICSALGGVIAILRTSRGP